MSYTGILLRGSSHAAMLADLPIHREIVVTEQALGVGWDTGSGVAKYWLNYETLSKIGMVAADGSGKDNKLRTSNLPIVFDSTAAELYLGTDKMTLKGSFDLS